MLELLSYTIGRIDSLQYFYKSELSSIERNSKKGMKETRFARLVNVYLQMLTSENEEDRQNESFLALKTYMDRHVKIKKIDTEGEKKNVVFELNEIKDGPDDFRRDSYEYTKFMEMPIIHGHNTLTMLITRFEEFISNFLKNLYVMYPSKYLNNQNITFSEIVNLGVDKIQEKIVLREVDAMMRESYMEWFKIFRSHNMDVDKCNDELMLLKEIYARRNILVHNSGIVNDIYLSNVDNSPYSLGEQLLADDEYLNKAFDAVKKIIYIIMHEAARFIKDNKKTYLKNIFYQAFDELCRENYEVSRKIFDILKENKYLDDQFRLMAKVNYWISIKELYGIERIKKELYDFDVSAYATSFALAKHILLEEYQEASVIIEKMLKNEEISSVELNEWPLFKRYRQTEQFEMFKTLYKDSFNMASVQTFDEEVVTEKGIRKELDEVEKNIENT